MAAAADAEVGHTAPVECIKGQHRFANADVITQRQCEGRFIEQTICEVEHQCERSEWNPSPFYDLCKIRGPAPSREAQRQATEQGWPA